MSGIRDLHMRTGEWVRQAARDDRVIVTERERPTTALVASREGDAVRSFCDHVLLPEFDSLPAVADDSTVDVSDDRDRA